MYKILVELIIEFLLRNEISCEVSKRGKTLSKKDLEKVSEIMSPFYDDDIDWEYKFCRYDWSVYGFCILFLRFGNLNCEIDDLLVLKRIDESIGWFKGNVMGNYEENLEYMIFRFKAVRIINNKSVKITKKIIFYFFHQESNKICISEMELLVKISRPKFTIFCRASCTSLNQQKRSNNFETKC